MKRLKLFSLFLLLLIGVGQMWGADPTISWAFKTLQTTSGTQDGITWETGKTGSANATICNSTKGMVLYGVTSGGGYFQTTSAIEGVITNITLVTTTQKNTPKYTVYGSTDGSNWTSIKGNIGVGTESIDTDDEYTYLKVANTTAATAQLGVTSITVTYTPSSGTNNPTYSIEPAVNHEGWGTATLNGSVITAEPASGYRYATPAYSVSGGTATVTQGTGDDVNKFTVSELSADVTVTINFVAIPTHTVTWSANGKTSNTSTVAEGAAITFPNTATGCDGGTFMGWASATIDGTLDEAPTYVTSANMGNTDVMYYAVFATASDDVEEETDTERGSTSSPYVANTGWSASAGGTYTTSGNYGNSSPSIKMSTNGDYVQSPTYSGAITAISYWYKPQNATGSISTFVSADGTSWTELTQEAVSFSNSSTASTKSITVSSSNGYKAVKIVYNKTTSNVAIDDIAITYEEVQYSDYRTSCCTKLGSMSGTVSASQTSAIVKLASAYAQAANADAYQLKVEGSSNYNTWQDVNKANLTTSAGVTVNGLTCGTQYTAYLRAKGSDTYCDYGTESHVDFTTSKYSIEKANSGTVKDGENNTIGTFAVTGNPTEACNPSTISLTYTITDNTYQFKAWNVHKKNDASTTVSVTSNQFSMPAYDVVVDLELEKKSTPTLTPSVDAVNFGNQEISTTSSPQAIAISGTNLEGTVAFEIIGTDESAFAVIYPASSPIVQASAEAQGGQTVQITFTPSSAKVHSATLRFTSTNATTRDVALSGTGINLYTVTLNVEGGNGLANTTGWSNPSTGVYTKKQTSLDEAISLPNATLSDGLSTAGWNFAGWKTEAVSAQTSDEQTFVNTAYTPTSDITLYAVYSVNAGGTAKDELNNSLTGITGSTYTAWSGKEGSASDAVYAGNSAGGNNSIQFRSDVSDTKPASGIISTTSGGKVSKITVTWQSATQDGRTLNVFGSNTAYSSPADLVDDNKKGTLLGTIVNGTSTELTVTGDYDYIGLRSNSGAMYLDAVQITWSTASANYFSNPSDKVSITYNANGGENAPAAQENITIGSNPTAAIIGSMEKEGHTFSNWNTKADGTGVNYDAGGTITNISTDLTLYAIWTKNSYTISVTDPGNGNSITAPENNASIEYGAKVTLTANPANTHWSFTSWSVADANEAPISLDEEGGVYSFNMPASNVTVSATFTEAAKRTVNFYINGGNAVQSGDVYVGETPSAPSAVAPECFGESNHFAGWATTPWTGAVDNATPITTLTAVEEGEGAISYHAVFAKGTEGESELAQTLQYDTWTYYGDASDQTSYRLFGNGAYVESAAFDLSTLHTVKVYGGTYGGDTYNSLTIGDGTNTWKSVTVTGKSATGENEYTGGTALSGTGKLYITSTCGNGSGNGIRISKVEIHTRSLTYSKYMTTCQSDLGAIDGTVGLAQVTEEGENKGKLQATWTMASTTGLADNGIIIKIYKDGETPELVETSDPLSNDAESYVWATAPDYCSEYYATLTPVKVDNTYKDGVEQGKSANNCVVGAQYTYTGNYSHVAPKDGETVAENSCSSFSVEFEGTESYTLPDEISVTGVSTYTWENGILSFDKADVTGNVSIIINGVEPPVTTLSATPNALDFGTPAVNESVTAQKFRISGVALSAGDITITSPNVGFTVSPSKLENIPAGNLEASEATEITVTPVTSTADVFDGNITISGCGASTTVTLTMTVKEIYTVNWYVNGSSTPARTQSGVSGTALTEIPNNFSSATDCMDKEFMGWATAPIANSQDEAPEGMITNTAEMTISGNADYYAVFATKVSEGGYEKVTDVSVLTAGDEIVIADGTIAMKAYESGNNFGEAAVTLNTTSDKITALGEGACEFTLGGTSGAWTLFDGEKYVYAAGTATTGKNHMKGKTANEDGDCDWEITITSGSTTVKSKTNTYTPYMRHNTANSLFSCYNSSSYGNAVTLFRKADAVYSAYVTTCPHITSVALSAGSAEHGSIAFKQGEEIITSVRTDGGVDVEVDVVASLDEGYELTGLTLTSEDVTGATKNDALTKITIPAGAEGTLTATPTITLTPKYSITFANGGATGGTAPEAIGDQLANAKVYLPENTYSWANHGFLGWTVATASGDIGIAEDANGKYFLMPEADVTVTAQWAEIAIAKISFMVGGEEKAFIYKEQEVAFTIEQGGADWAPSGFTFVGWAIAEQEEETAVAPATITEYTPQAGIAEVSLYGIYSRLDDSDVNYGKYEKATAIAEGDYLIVCENQNVAFDGSLETLDASSNTQAVAITDGALTLEDAEDYVFTIAEVNEGYSIRAASGKYIGQGSDANGLTASASALVNTISITYGNADIVSAGGAYLRYNATSGQERFRYFKSSTYSSQQAIQLYKKNNGVTKYTSSPVEKVTITFDLDGGQGGCQTTKINKGGELTICENIPTKTHSEFAGWKLNETSTIYQANENIGAVDEDITLTAQWADASTYAVTYDVNGATAGDVPTIDAQYAGDNFDVAAKGDLVKVVDEIPYEFQGWKYNNKLYKAGVSFTMPTEAVIFVAQWKKTSIQTDKMSLITEASALADGMKVALGCSYGENSFEMAGDITGSNKYMSSVSGNNIALSNGVATYTGDVVVLTLEQVDNSWKITKDGTNYLTLTSDNIKWDTKANATDWTISFEDGNVKIAASTYWIQFNSGSNNVAARFKTYGSSSNMKAIQLFGKAIVVEQSASISELGYVEGETIVASGQNVTVTIDAPTNAKSVKAQNGATVKVEKTTTATSIEVDDESKIEVTASTTVNEVFSVAATMGGGKSGQISGVSNVTIAESSEAFFDITLGDNANPDHWHAIAVPFPVDVINGIYDAATGAKLNNEEHYAIMAYDGSERAKGNYGWKKYRQILQPGVFYLMTVDGNTKTFRFKMSGTTLPTANSLALELYAQTSGDNKDGGWNGVANPTLQHGTVNQTVTVLNPNTYTYEDHDAGSYNFVVGTPFFIQADQSIVDEGMSMGAVDGDKPYYAPRRASEKSIENVKVFFGNEAYKDKLTISANEEALNEYQIGKDLVKMTMTNTPSVAQIFGNAYNDKMSRIYAPMVNDRAEYSLTLYAPQAGEYTISAQEMEDADLYLTQNGSIIWNLSMSEYVADFAKGNNEGYGLLLIKKAPGIATGVDEISGEKAGVQKIVIEDKVFILRGGKMYDVTGKAVK